MGRDHSREEHSPFPNLQDQTCSKTNSNQPDFPVLNLRNVMRSHVIAQLV